MFEIKSETYVILFFENIHFVMKCAVAIGINYSVSITFLCLISFFCSSMCHSSIKNDVINRGRTAIENL